MNYPIVKNTCLKCGAVRYEPQNFLVMCKVCDCIMKDRKPDDRNNLDKGINSLEPSVRKIPDNSPQTKPQTPLTRSNGGKQDKTGDTHIKEDKAK